MEALEPYPTSSTRSSAATSTSERIRMPPPRSRSRSGARWSRAARNPVFQKITSTSISTGSANGCHDAGSANAPEADGPSPPAPSGVGLRYPGKCTLPGPIRVIMPRLTSTPDSTPATYSPSIGIPVVRTTLAGASPAPVRSRTAASTSSPQRASKVRSVKFGGRRVAQTVSVTGASWSRNCTADRPPPTTSVRLPVKSSAERKPTVCSWVPVNVSIPGT